MTDVKTRYQNYRKEIREYMDFFIGNLIEKYGEVNESYVVSLDLLALNLDVMFKAVDEMREKGMTENDKYRGEKKSGAMQAFFNSQNYIHKLIASFGFTPSSKSKIRETQTSADIARYLEGLTQ